MTILFITHYDNLYGANNAMLSLLLKLKDSGDTVIVAGPAGQGQLKFELKRYNIEYIQSEMTQWMTVYSTPLRFLVKKIKRSSVIKKEVNALYEKLKDKKIDIIHTNSSVIAHGAMLSEMLGTKHVWHIREFAKEHFNMRPVYKAATVTSLFNKADCLVAISDAIKNNYSEKYPEANIIRVYDGVNRETEPEYYTNEFKVKFIYTGYLFSMKQQLEVINACKKLYADGYTAFELHIVGDGKTEYKEKLQKAIDGLPVTLIQLRGYVADVNSLLDTMDVGIIASLYEGFGLVTVEYMLAKKPVIGRKHGGTKEIVADNETGILYSTEQELIAAMKKLIDDKELRKTMGLAGYERAVSKFSLENNVSEIQRIYQSIL